MLSYGDLITLAPAPVPGDEDVPKGLLEAEGLLDPRVWVRSGHELLDGLSAVFEILPLRREEESDMNEEMKGSPVLFGHLVQLRHVPSAKYISLVRVFADLEPGSLAVELSARSTSSCWLSMQPTSAARNEGDVVRLGDSVQLQGAKIRQQLHCSAQTLPDAEPIVRLENLLSGGPVGFARGARHEVNSKLARCPWRVQRYAEGPAAAAALAAIEQSAVDGSGGVSEAAAAAAEAAAAMLRVGCHLTLADTTRCWGLGVMEEAHTGAHVVRMVHLGGAADGGGAASDEIPCAALLPRPASPPAPTARAFAAPPSCFLLPRMLPPHSHL